MLKGRWKLSVVASWALTVGGAGTIFAADPSVSDILRFKPRQAGIECSTPKPEEEAKCSVKLERGAGKTSGYILRDAQGKLMRRFWDTTGDGRIHEWSYYRDGIEVYREVDTNADGRPDQYRWLNLLGTKWGSDPDQNGIIDEWKMIAAEEACQEIVQSLIAKDFARLKTVLITDAEIKALGMSDVETKRVTDLRAKADTVFKKTLEKTVHFSDKTHILNVDMPIPHCVPAEQLNSKYDLIKRTSIGMVCGTGEKDKPTTWIQSGEMVLIGNAWRLVSAPTEGIGGPEPVETDNNLTALQKSVTDLDEAFNKKPNPAADELIQYHLKRVEMVKKIIEYPKVPDEERDLRIRELADGLSAAAQSGHKDAYKMLEDWHKRVLETKWGGDAMAGLVTFRILQTKYALNLKAGSNITEKGQDISKIQGEWAADLAKFVQSYPKSSEVPEALKELGMVSEFLGKEVEAKNWYQQLVQNYKSHPFAELAEGCLRRIDLEGKVLELKGKKIFGGGDFSVEEMKGKVVLVYYWAGWNQQCVGDFARLKFLLESNSGKGVELVSVNLDHKLEEAQQFLQKSPSPGVHLFQPNLDSSHMNPLAAQYGIHVLPQMFLVGKDGKVVSRSVQVSNVADELAKLLK